MKLDVGHADPRSQDASPTTPGRSRPWATTASGRRRPSTTPTCRWPSPPPSTSRIKLGTNIATVFSRSPMITAHIAWDLQKASGGRFTLGLGTQVKAHNERRFSVKFESPGPKMARGRPRHPRHLGLLAERHQAQLQGAVLHLRRDDAVLQPGPDRAPEDPDLHRGGEPAACAASRASCATACTCTRSTARSTSARSCTRRWRKGSSARGARARTSPTRRPRFVVVGDTEKERAAQAQTVKQQIAFYGSTRTYQPGAGRPRLGGPRPASSTASRWRATGRAWPT